jgi:bifunctional non-homologous end joining protein LigD
MYEDRPAAADPVGTQQRSGQRTPACFQTNSCWQRFRWRHFALIFCDMLRQRKSRLVGFIEPCLPSPAKVPPSGPDWIHEIKHDGFRIMARRDAAGVRLITRKGNDLTRRFPFIAMAVAALPVASCLIDGEAIVSDDNGLAIFDRIRGNGTLANATLGAFDLLQVDGRDLRREPLEGRKRALAKLLRRSHSSVVVNEHFAGDGAIVSPGAVRRA